MACGGTRTRRRRDRTRCRTTDAMIARRSGRHETAAFRGTIDRKRRDRNRTAGHQRATQRRDVTPSVLFVLQTVKDGPVVPETVSMRRIERGDVGLNPLDCTGPRTEPRACQLESHIGNVHYGHRRMALIEQPVDEHRRTATDVDDACVLRDSGVGDQPERDVRLFLVPADALRSLFPAGATPMVAAIHPLQTRGAVMAALRVRPVRSRNAGCARSPRDGRQDP
jgi:hypothetical protein